MTIEQHITRRRVQHPGGHRRGRCQRQSQPPQQRRRWRTRGFTAKRLTQPRRLAVTGGGEAMPNALATKQASVVVLVVLIADGIVERRDLSGEQAFELVIPIDGVGQMDVERREVDLEGRKLIV
jgi:hypothetical protein